MQLSAAVRDTNGYQLEREGAIIRSWREQDMDIFFPRQYLKLGDTHKLRGGMHPCFPNFGQVNDKYNLPQHGPLRTVGCGINCGGRPLKQIWFAHSNKLLGSFNQPCKVGVKTERLDKGFSYELSAELDSTATRRVPISAGLHPYFATPRGAAIVSTDKSYPVTELLTTPMGIPLTQRVTIDITHLGQVQMTVLGDFLNTDSARIVLWRDTFDYLCVEPVLAMPNQFDTPACPSIGPGEKIELRCVFKYLS